jgi:hypothetical protein
VPLAVPPKFTRLLEPPASIAVVLDGLPPFEEELVLPPTSLGPVDPFVTSLQATKTRHAYAESCSAVDRFITLPRQSYSLNNDDLCDLHIPKSVHCDRKHAESQ